MRLMKPPFRRSRFCTMNQRHVCSRKSVTRSSHKCLTVVRFFLKDYHHPKELRTFVVYATGMPSSYAMSSFENRCWLQYIRLGLEEGGKYVESHCNRHRLCSAVPYLKNIIRCHCKPSTQNPCGTRTCSCRKHDIPCLPTCSECHREECNNCNASQMDDSTNNDENEYGDSQTEDQLVNDGIWLTTGPSMFSGRWGTTDGRGVTIGGRWGYDWWTTCYDWWTMGVRLILINSVDLPLFYCGCFILLTLLLFIRNFTL